MLKTLSFALALALLSQEAAAYNTMCSNGSGHIEVLNFDAYRMVVSSENRHETFTFVSSVGTGLNGEAYQGPDGQFVTILGAEVEFSMAMGSFPAESSVARA
jgi:hypothetical protein